MLGWVRICKHTQFLIENQTEIIIFLRTHHLLEKDEPKENQRFRYRVILGQKELRIVSFD